MPGQRCSSVLSRYSPLCWQLAFSFRRHKTNCHVLQVPRKMSGHQELLACGTGLSDDFSKTQELASKDQFPFEPPGRAGAENPRQGVREP